MSKDLILKEVKSFFIALLGFLLLAIVTNLFSWQFKLVSGGFPGFGLLISYVTSYSVGQFLLFLNIIILLLLFIFVGKNVGIKSAIGFILFPILIDLTRKLINLSQHESSSLLMSITYITIQAFLAGIAVSLFFSQKYSAGGWGSLAFIVTKYLSISGPQFLFIMDILLTILVTLFLDLSKGIILGINSIVFYYSFKSVLKYLEVLTNKYDKQ